MSELKEKLFSEFPPVSTDEWMAKITADLKGAPFEKKLIWKTNEGFEVRPFYREEDIKDLKTTKSLPSEFPFIRGTKKDNEWMVRQDIEVEDFAAANKKALDLLNKGITSLGFSFKKDKITPENISLLLSGIAPEAVELNFRTCLSGATKLLGILTNYLKAAGADLNKCYGSVNYDVFKNPFLKGYKAEDWTDEAIEVLNAAAELPKFRVLAVNAMLLSDSGAYISQELGYALAWGNDLIAKLTEKGIAVDEVAKRIKFNFGVSSNFFMEIAKFRAARWLWAQIVAQYKPNCECSAKMVAHAITSKWNMTIFDAHVNLLRTQTEAMSAAIAGVDSITVLPFDNVFKKSDDFSERIARNQQLLLKEECHFDKVADPAAGSYYVEVLTNSMADVAWKLFLEVEEAGGFTALADKGDIQNAVNASAVARQKAVATRREILLGTNQYPNFTEVAGEKIKIDAGCGCACACSEEKEVPTLNNSRGASEFEALRLATEKSGKEPKVFMLTIGSLAMRLARSQFSSNFFACAGYKVIDNLGFETVEAGVEAAVKANADIVVLCSSDEEYADLAPAAYKALNGRAEFVVAGAPECMEDLKAQGITQFINVKSNVLETLKTFNAKLGIA